MKTTKQERKPHSAEFFGEVRDYWWNSDFLELIAKRVLLARAQNVLDVGCGIGHWGQLLAPLLSKDAQVTGIDREELWVKKAAERAEALGLANRYRYRRGDATALPFAEGEFDLVTCQTVLIHLKDPRVGLREMWRALKSGGTLLVAEPNNLANRAIMSNLAQELSVEEIVQRFKFGLIVERGKEAMGLGYNSVGDLVPGYLAELGARNIRVYLSDKAAALLPPYSSKEERAHIQQIRNWAERGFIGWDRDEVFDYFIAGGGRREDFDRCFRGLVQDGENMKNSIEGGAYHCGGGGITYLISAQKA